MSFKIVAFIAVLAFVLSTSAAVPANHIDPVSGEWNVVFSIQGQTANGVLNLKLSGHTVTGTIESAHTGPGKLTKGTWNGDKLSFTMEFEKHESIAVTGGAKDGKLSGEFATEGTTGTWTAVKKKSAISST